MDVKLVKGLSFSWRRKKWLVLLAVFGASGYGVYKIYNLPSVVKRRNGLIKLFGALISVAELVADSSDAVGVVAKDLRKFLKSDSDEIPNSLKQLSKMAKSEEFSDSLVKVTEALTIGLLRGYTDGTKYGNEVKTGTMNTSFSDSVLDRLFSTAGSGFMSVVVGSFAKNLVMGFFSGAGSGNDSNVYPKTNISQYGSNLLDMPGWLNLILDHRCKTLVADCIQVFVSTAVAVYLEKSTEVNTYDQLFSGLTNPQHQSKVEDFLVPICNGAVETLVKTSHKVLTRSECSSNSMSVLSHSMLEQREGSNKAIVNENFDQDPYSKQLIEGNLCNKFILDLTGRVAFETTKSAVEFLSWKLMDGFKRSVYGVHEEFIDRGLQVVRYFGSKSSIIVMICISLYLHILCSTRVFLPA